MHTGRVWLKTIAHVGLPRRFSVEDSVLPLQGTQVWSLVRELRFHMPCSAVKTKFKKKKIRSEGLAGTPWAMVSGPFWAPHFWTVPGIDFFSTLAQTPIPLWVPPHPGAVPKRGWSGLGGWWSPWRTEGRRASSVAPLVSCSLASS